MYACAVCKHKWFSRTNNIPLRCPECKTRSWRSAAIVKPSGGSYHRIDAQFTDGDILERYRSGEGCVSISMSTGLSLSAVIEVLMSETDERPLRM